MFKQLSAVVVVTLSMLAYAFAPVAHSDQRVVPVNTQFDISDYAGKVVNVDFWASWCRPCRQSFPFMNELQMQFRDELAIVAINVDERKEDALRFLQAFNPEFTIVYDPAGELASAFEVPGMPTTYLFDRAGTLIKRHIGFKKSQAKTLQKMVSDAINNTSVVAENE